MAPVKKIFLCLSKVPKGFNQSSFLSSTTVAKERNHCALSTSLANHHFRYLDNPLLQPLGYRYWGTHKNYYYSFKIFPRFWLFITTRIIHHNQLLLTKLGNWGFVILNRWRQRFCHIDPMMSKWRQRSGLLQVVESLTRKPGEEVVLFLVSRKTKSEMAELL